MLVEGQQVELTIEKPAAGGWMIARHHGQVVLVRGAIPGERVTAWIERAEKRVAYGVTRDVLEPSPDRRQWDGDPLCGGALYAHIAYPRQLTIKEAVVRDAFARLGRHPLDGPMVVAGSPEEGYRMRARFHVQGGRAGFYRESTHQLCEAASTRQLLGETIQAVESLARTLDHDAAGAVTSITVAENIAADQRTVHLDLRPNAQLPVASLDRVLLNEPIAGISARGSSTPSLVTAGTPWVVDPICLIAASDAAPGNLRRHAEAFFQGNRFLLHTLVRAVIESVSDESPVLDLYAGVGLFSTALVAVRNLDVIAVEGDRASGADLAHNARAHGSRLEAVVANVEDYLRRPADRRAPTVIIDPPRTGLSREAADGVIRYGARKIVYVSCDPPTLARDARRLLDGGYQLTAIQAFDMFPNTPHVEVVSVFERT